MKTASVLFGLMVATGVAHADRAPAKPAAKPVAARALPTGTQALLRQLAAPGIQITRTIATPAVQRPRVDANGDMACGNVMSKSGDDKCTARVAARQPAPAPIAVARPLVDADGDPAPGNVMKKTKK